MKLRVVIFYRLQQVPNLDVGVQFLSDLAHERLLTRLPNLYLASRKFPPILIFAVATLSGENFPSRSITAATTSILFIDNTDLLKFRTSSISDRH